MQHKTSPHMLVLSEDTVARVKSKLGTLVNVVFLEHHSPLSFVDNLLFSRSVYQFICLFLSFFIKSLSIVFRTPEIERMPHAPYQPAIPVGHLDPPGHL